MSGHYKKQRKADLNEIRALLSKPSLTEHEADRLWYLHKVYPTYLWLPGGD